MKIADIGKIQKESQSVTAPHDKLQPEETGVSFRRHISDINDARYQEHIEELRERIFEQGEVIKKKSDINEFIKYRKLIAELMGEVAGNAYESSKTSSFDARGKHKVFVLIKKVNSKLDEMARQVLDSQSENIKLLQMVDDIRGMLVDMFL